MVRKLNAVKWIAVPVWIAGWIMAAPYSMLDDALIHLRYASYLHDLHRITYDGIHFSYGTSSLAYVSLLAFLRGISLSPVLPKIVATTAYVLAVVVLLSLERRFERRSAPYAIWAGLVVVSLTPMAMRWLTDGMETSLVALCAIGIALSAERLARTRVVSASAYIVFAALGCFLVLLRVELLILVFLASGVAWFGRLAHRDPQESHAKLFVQNAPMALGALLGATCIRMVFGNLIPDTALAKESGFSIGPVLGFVHVTLSSFAFGTGLVLLTLLSAILLLRELLNVRPRAFLLLQWACANAGLPFELAICILRGQAIHGIRYFVWPLYFSAVFNAIQWARLRKTDVVAAKVASWTRPLLYASVSLFICLLVPDWSYALVTMRGRSQTFEMMRNAGLDRYRNDTIVASDVGFIGYFSRGNICDLSGLVGGRELARLSTTQRARRCAEMNPQMLFLDGPQLQEISPYMSLSGWTAVQDFAFPNVSAEDPHFVMVRRGLQAVASQ